MARTTLLFMTVALAAQIAALPARADDPGQPPSAAPQPPAAAAKPDATPPAAPPASPPPASSAQAPAPTPPAPAKPLAVVKDTINNAKQSDGPAEKDGISPAIVRAEILLDRVHASPGVIDGRAGANLTHALEVYEHAKGLPESKGLDDKVWGALMAEGGPPVVKDYVLTDQDVAGPFYPDLPTDYAALAKLPTIGFRSPSQKIGEKFHMGETLLAALNPGVDLGKAGTTIVVADVTPIKVRGTVKDIVVDKAKSQVLGYDGHGHVLVAYPATIGSRELPSPSGSYKVKGIAFNPIYYYDPEKNFTQGDNKEKLKLPPGPNNPVGEVFIALTKPTYGLHGTPDPAKIDKTASHGCVRMTNWDAIELAHLVKRGVVVRFKS